MRKIFTFNNLQIIYMMIALPWIGACTTDTRENVHSTISMQSMAFNKTRFSSDDTLIVQLTHPHPRQLGIKTPDGIFFFIAGNPELRPTYTSAEFVKMNVIEIPLSLFKAYPHIYNITEKRLVFQKHGTYQFIISNNLESDDPSEIKEIYFSDTL